MHPSKLRRQIILEAAQMIYSGREPEFHQAKLKAARRIHPTAIAPAELPPDAEIREEIESLARAGSPDQRHGNLKTIRQQTLRVMRVLAAFDPQVTGPLLTGQTGRRNLSEIPIRVFTDDAIRVSRALAREGFESAVQHRRATDGGDEHTMAVRHADQRYCVQLTISPPSPTGTSPSQTCRRPGASRESANLAEFEDRLLQWYPELNLDEARPDASHSADRFATFFALLAPLENVKQNPQRHPEGDALFHSLQVFDLARDALPYDEEFLLAALLHDVGKALDPEDAVTAGLEALEGWISPRTRWLIAHHKDVLLIRDGSIGYRAHKRLKDCESYDELLLLSQCDRNGRRIGAPCPDLPDAIAYLQELERMCSH